MVSIAYSEACAEVLILLKKATPEEKSKIPQKFLNFLTENASKTYKVSFDVNKPIKELNLKKETKGILSVIYYSFLCNNEEKEEYAKLLRENQIKYDEELRKECNPDDIFKDRDTVLQSKPVSSGMELTEYKENIFVRIINKIKNFFSML